MAPRASGAGTETAGAGEETPRPQQGMIGKQEFPVAAPGSWDGKRASGQAGKAPSSAWGTKLHAGRDRASPSGEAGIRAHSRWAGKTQERNRAKRRDGEKV